MLQRLDPVRNSTRSYHRFPETFKMIAIALGGLAVLTLLVMASNRAEMPGDMGDPTSLYGP
jgi:hypothetical protein